MRIGKPLFDFYINSSIHVALAIVSLCTVTFLHFGFLPNVDLLLFVFFGSITGYNFVKFAGVAKLHHRSLAKGLRMIQIFSLLSFLFFLWEVFQVEFKILAWTTIFGLITLLYALPVFSKKRNLRSVSGVKIFIIAFVWAGVTVVLPVTLSGEVYTVNVGLEFFQRFLLVLVWILPFEIRDLRYDLIQLGTIPQRIGVTKTKILGLVLLGVVVLSEGFKTNGSLSSFVALLIIALISAGFIWKSRERQAAYYSSFWVEAIPIIWVVILLLFRSL